MATNLPNKEIKLPLTIKPDFFTYFLGGALSFIFWLPMLLTVALRHWDWKLFGFCSGMTVSMCILIHGCRIVIGLNALTYKRLFFCSKSLPYNQMKELKIETRVMNSGSQRKPVYGLVVMPDAETQDTLTINTKLFSRRDLTELLRIVSSKAPQARLDERCEEMKEGFMPSLVGNEKKMRSRSKFWDFMLKER